MSATNTQSDDNTNDAGVPPAPSEAFQRAAGEQPTTKNPHAMSKYQSDILHRQALAEHVCQDRYGRLDCVCVQCRRIREMLDIPAPTGRTTC